MQGLQDSRYGRFGLWLGIGVAVIVHLLLFVLPSPRLGESKDKETERGMVARAYRMNPFPLPGSGSGAPAPTAPRAPTPGASESGAPKADTAPARVSDAAVGVERANLVDVPSATGSVTQQGSDTGGVGGAASEFQGSGGDSRTSVPQTSAGGGSGAGTGYGPGSEAGSGAGQGSPGSGSGQATDWDRVMAMLADKRQELSVREAQLKTEREKQIAPLVRQKAAEKAQVEDSLLDPRIRMSVVSYPPTAIEKKFPAIPYPDLKFRRSQIEAGICRVYLRVWTDNRGRITKSELKSPADRPSQEKYEPFVTAVKNSVETWSFEPVEAQVHVDVLFEIK